MRRFFKLCGVSLALALDAACGGGTPGTGGAGQASQLSGNIFVSGSSTVEPITARVAEEFSKNNPGVAIKVDGPGTGDGFKLFCNGETDISDASRAIRKEEADACKQKNVEFIELKVAIDGLSVITSKRNNTVECLSFPDLYALLGPESQGFKNWSDANALGKAVGGSGDYPNAPLVVTAPGEESGTYDSFVEIVLDGTAKKQNKKAQVRPDYQASPNDNVIIEGISGSPTSLGWVGYSFVQENTDKVKVLKIEKEEGKGCVEPNAQTIADNTFPISRPLFIYVNKAKLDSNKALGPFVDFYLSDEGLASVKEVGYVPLSAADIAKTKATWQAKTAGSAA